jgi:hypothetical protein
VVKSTWFKWVARAIAALAILWVVTWLAVPPLVRWQAPQRLGEALGRPVTLGAVDFHPWGLEIVLHDLAVGPAAGASAPAPLLRVGRVRANVALSSLVRRAPVIEALDIDAAQLALARTAPGHYDIDDLLARFTPKPDAAPSEPARFALYNLQVRDLTLRFDDRPEGRVHVVEALQLSLPFLSNLPAQVDVTVQPRLAFRLDGARFDSTAQATPFAAARHGAIKLALADLDLQPWLGYLPETLPVRVTRGVLSADVDMSFAQAAQGSPSLAFKGWIAARGVAVDNPAGLPLLQARQLRVELADVQPLVRKLAFGALRMEGPEWHLDRAKDGTVDALRMGASPAPAVNVARAGPAASAASAPAATSDPAWQVGAASLDIVDGAIAWHDAAVAPAADLRVEGFALSVKKPQWPTAAPIAFELAARIAAPAAAASAARLALKGTATEREAQADLTLSDLDLQALAPYVAQHLVPRVDGRVDASASLQWSADTAAPRLQLKLTQATLDHLRVGGGATPPAALDRLALADLQVDVPARTLAIGNVTLVRPTLRVARDAAGRIDAMQWLRDAPQAATAPASAATTPPWRVQVHAATLEGGTLGFSDASLHPEQPLLPWRAELRQLQLDVREFAWFGDRPVAPAQVRLSARVGRPADNAAQAARGGELAWKGQVGLAPLRVAGQVDVTRFPVTLVTPWVADRLPVSLLRAQADWHGQVDVQAQPAGLALSARGDALVGDVHLSTLPAAASASAPAVAPEELLAWQALRVQGLRFAMAPQATPRLDIAHVTLQDLQSRLVVTEQGRFNLTEAVGPGPAPAASAPAPAASAPPAPAAAASATPPVIVNVGGITLANASIAYTDHFVRPNYSAALTELNGSLGAFGSGSRDMAALQLHGKAEGTATLDIAGKLNPLAHPLALDIQAKATDLELAPLTPYAGKYAGYAIERGKLSLDVAYRVDADGTLQARNKLVLNQLTFGDPIASPDATKLPVRLAVALLKDRDGVIDIDLPVSGSLADPEFSVGGIIGRLLVNLLVKAVSSPFSLLAGGGDGPDLNAIEFRPGSAVPTEAGSAALAKVAQALVDRPALQLTITGSADPVAERADAQREAVEAQLATLAGAQAGALAPERRAALVKTLYAQTRMADKPRNVLGMAKDLPTAGMEALLRSHATVDTETMRQRALARAIAVRDALAAKGVATDRMFLAAPQLHAAGAGDTAWKPQASLALATK